MQLQREPPCEFRLLGVAVVEHGGECVVDPHCHVRRGGADAVAVPIVSPHDCANRIRRREDVEPRAAVRGDRQAHAPLHEQPAAVLVVDPPEPGLAVVEIGLVALGVAVRQPLAAILDSRVGRRISLDSVFEREIEVGDRAIPPEKLVVAEFFTGGYLRSDCAVLDPPAVGRAAPAGERAAVKDRPRLGGPAGPRRGQDRNDSHRSAKPGPGKHVVAARHESLLEHLNHQSHYRAGTAAGGP